MTDIKTNFHTWLTQSKDNQSKTTPLTANEYINRLNRLSKRLYDKEGLQYISDNIYILRLLFMDSSNWVNIPSEDLDDVIVYLYNYKQKNRNFNDHYNQFFHSLRKHLNEPLSFSSKHPYFFFDILRNTEEYMKLSDWVKHVFVTEKSLKYLSWLYINKTEKRKIAAALSKFSTFLVKTRVVSQGTISLLNRFSIWKLRKNIVSTVVKIDEANGIEGRNFYSRYVEGKAEKLLSMKEAKYILGCSDEIFRNLLKNGKLHFKSNSNMIDTENMRRFLRRKHIRRSVGTLSKVDEDKNPENWLQMKEAVALTGNTASYIRWQVKKGRVAYIRYSLKKFKYFKPDLLKI
ncbi:MAG: hypothetical protein IJS88_00875 [Alphaproteobacteria bacterium]|nr:hypothetical protein [Alphaproteobacteria bacterium]